MTTPYSRAQQAAIGCLDKPLQIIACAGSGKTQLALQLMLAQLVDAGGFQRVQHGLGNWYVHVFTRIIFVFQPRPAGALSACPRISFGSSGIAIL